MVGGYPLPGGRVVGDRAGLNCGKCGAASACLLALDFLASGKVAVNAADHRRAIQANVCSLRLRGCIYYLHGHAWHTRRWHRRPPADVSVAPVTSHSQMLRLRFVAKTRRSQETLHPHLPRRRAESGEMHDAAARITLQEHTKNTNLNAADLPARGMRNTCFTALPASAS